MLTRIPTDYATNEAELLEAIAAAEECRNALQTAEASLGEINPVTTTVQQASKLRNDIIRARQAYAASLESLGVHLQQAGTEQPEEIEGGFGILLAPLKKTVDAIAGGMNIQDALNRSGANYTNRHLVLAELVDAGVIDDGGDLEADFDKLPALQAACREQAESQQSRQLAYRESMDVAKRRSEARKALADELADQVRLLTVAFGLPC